MDLKILLLRFILNYSQPSSFMRLKLEAVEDEVWNIKKMLILFGPVPFIASYSSTNKARELGLGLNEGIKQFFKNGIIL